MGKTTAIPNWCARIKKVLYVMIIMRVDNMAPDDLDSEQLTMFQNFANAHCVLSLLDPISVYKCYDRSPITMIATEEACIGGYQYPISL